MKFQFIFENFKALPNGTDAFKQLKILCEQEIGNNNNLDNSALFLIYGFAKNYVLLYEDQEVTPEFAKKAKSTELEKDYKELGKRVFKFLKTQNENESEYVELKN